MFPINQFNIQTVSEGKTEGVFKIEPLPKGYGHTLGTVLRRILLSSIPGAAVTSVKIHGVQHEYTTVAGLQEDVLSVVLAIKGIAVVSHTNDPVTLTLDVKGSKGSPRVVTAADIDKNPMVEIVNPEHEITTLSDEKAHLKAEITVSKGVGYALPDEGLREEIGVIPLDAVYTPVERVSVEVENARVGQQTDLDSLKVVLFTNGTVTPSAVLYEAAELLQGVSNRLVELSRALLNAKATQEVKEAVLPMGKESMGESASGSPLLASELNLSTRLANALSKAGYEDLRVLDGLTEEEVRNIDGLGEKSFHELLEVLAANGVRLI